MCMTKVVLVGQSNFDGLGDAYRRSLVQPVFGLNVVLIARWRGVTGAAGAIWGSAKALEKVVGSAVFLNDDYDMTKTSNLSLE